MLWAFAIGAAVSCARCKGETCNAPKLRFFDHSPIVEAISCPRSDNLQPGCRP